LYLTTFSIILMQNFLRETILKFGKIEIIIDLDEVRLFHNENPETIIFKFKKESIT
jgi:hypothetical protein